MKLRNYLTVFATMLAMLLMNIISAPVQAQTVLPTIIIDDFEDNDVSDWGYFGGSNGGGGFGVGDDRPQDGSYYLSTGWGGGGAGGFYGGLFKNFDNASQIVLPTDAWLNVWVYNQDNATSDQYQLEITIREDTDGDGWADGVDDSFRLDTVFTSAEYDNQWRLISAPVSSFAPVGAGGDDIFNGNLDEIVLVIAGVQGADPAIVELDIDDISFSAGGPEVSALTIFDDMEHGDPFANGWFSFNGSVGGGGLGANTADLPPTDGGAFSIETGWGSGGTPGFYGGFGRTNTIDLTGTNTFSFWINPNAGQEYLLEINLQEDDNGDNLADAANDDEFQYNCQISATGPCAIAGGGWQLVQIPLEDFFDDNSFFSAGNGVLDATPVSAGGNGQLVNIVVAVIGSGTDANFRTDYWVFDQVNETGSPTQIVDDFENGLPTGVDSDGVPIGFFVVADGGSTSSINTTATPPAPVPDSVEGNNVMAFTADVTAFAVFIHSFENSAVDTWETQDWSSYGGLRFWFYGQNTGTTIFVDVIDNRNPDSTTDDAERFSITFADDFSGWQLIELPFEDFLRKEIGNGAPNDGFNLTQVHGWALGALETAGEQTFYVDDATLYGEAVIPELAVTFAGARFDIEEGTTGDVTVKLNRAMNSDDPAQVSVDYSTFPGVAIPGREYTPASGTLTFTNGGPSELTFSIETFDDTKWEGDERIGLSLTNPVDVETGFATLASAFIIENDMLDPNLVDDFSHGPYLWEGAGDISTKEIEAGDAAAIPGQDAYETVLNVDLPQYVEVVVQGNMCKRNGVIPVILFGSDVFDVALVDHTTVMLGDASESHVNKKTGIARRHEEDANGDGYPDLVFHFRAKDANIDCNESGIPFSGQTYAGQQLSNESQTVSFSRDFPDAEDWSTAESMSFWYYGQNSGEAVTVNLLDNRADDPGPSGWEMVWAEEFNEPAGTTPNPEFWTYEIGDVTPDGKNGWGNDERQYYTDDPANAATDGNGNMVLTVREDDSGRDCYYGECEYTSARLISWRKAEFAYGRIESRIKVPPGEGIWPAFWSLGTDIDVVSWPQTGEIDFMEFVGRLPNEIFGTIHGPGYAGGASFGNIYTFDEPVYNDYHTFAVEWEPDLIKWYVDGILYHTATPDDVAPNEWVFNDEVFLLLNVAIGGNFGGAIDPNIELPASMAVDYIRVYQGPDTAERFETAFTDDFSGWQEVTVPFDGFTRSAEQPAGAPDDGLTLTGVRGFGFEVPADGSSVMIDQVHLDPIPLPSEVTVTTLADSGPGSLRDAIAGTATDGTITFDASLAGGTITLTSGQLLIDRSVTIDGSDAAGLTVSGNNSSRVFLINAPATVSMNDLTVSDGVGSPQGGGILNGGVLNLDRMVVTNNTESSGAPVDFQFGGGGIYNGDGATLNLTNSTVSNNSTLTQPGGGIYGFFNSTINVTNSTISGNVGADVAGGLRTLGDVTIVNSTISGNTSTAWHGGGMFSTDGSVTILNTTITGNNAPAGTAGGLMIASFGNPVNATIQNSIIADNGSYGCQVEGGAASLSSLGNNISSDPSCALDASDLDVGAGGAGLGTLANNGGPTLTHALEAGSPAIDAANGAACPATDQRGVARPQGSGCDIGAVEAN